MSAAKLSSQDVPSKFTEWLLNMGCPQEKIPSLEKIRQMCRGQYYMVWRSLMERVHPKDVVQEQKMQVFCDDIQICKEKKAIEVESNVVIPEQLIVWKQQMELNQKVADAEAQVMETRHNLEEILNKNSKKLIQRNNCQRRIQDIQRRVWLLRQVASDLVTKKNSLEETKNFAGLFNSVNNENDAQANLDKCITMLQHQNPPSKKLDNPVASSSVISTEPDTEEIMETLTKCRGDVLWPQLIFRRASLVAELAAAHTDSTSKVKRNQLTPQSVLAQTASLQTTLALEVMKNGIHIENTRDKIVASIEALNNCLSSEECELLVLRCEKASTETRVKTLKSLIEELVSRKGIFCVGRRDTEDTNVIVKKITDIDKNITAMRDELKTLLMSLATIERKIQNIRKCLIIVFDAFRKEHTDDLQGTGIQLDLPLDAAYGIRKYFSERQEKARNKTNMSLDLDISEGSFCETYDQNNLKFVDELKIFMKKFNLERNRKLVLDSGEIIWCFQTLQASVTRLQSHWQNDDVTPLLCPTVRLSRSLQQLAEEVENRNRLCGFASKIGRRSTSSFVLDINPKIEEENQLLDKTKKRIADNLTRLQKITKTLDLSQYNLEFWSDDRIKIHISSNRTVDGRNYKYYEALYLESVM